MIPDPVTESPELAVQETADMKTAEDNVVQLATEEMPLPDALAETDENLDTLVDESQEQENKKRLASQLHDSSPKFV